jgi:CspA family cold shock protein
MDGVIKRLVTEKRFGFIRTEDGQEYFFHATAVTGKRWEELSEGMEVEFEPEKSNKGLRAGQVQVG